MEPMINRLRDDQIESPFSDDDIHDHQYFNQLRRKLRWQLLVTYVTPLILLSAYFHYQYNKTLRQGIDMHLRSAAENKRNTVSLFLQERVSNTRSAFHFVSLPPSSADMLEVLRGLRKESPTFVDVGLFSPEGMLVSYAGPHRHLRGKNYGKERWFLQLSRRQQDHFVSDVFRGFRDRPHFIIAVRKSFQGKGWTLRASVDPEKFAQYVSKSIHMKETEAFVINRQGRRQTSSRTGGPGETIPITPPSSTLETQVAEVKDKGKEYLSASAWFSVADWGLVVRVPTAIALAPVRRARLMLVGILMLALVVLVLLVARRTSKIVGRLEAADTSKVDLQRQLFNAAKLASVGEMAAGVAHEINNPLAIVYEEAGMMRDVLNPQFNQQLDPDDFRERLDAIMAASIRGRTITRKLMAFARKHDTELELADINHVLEMALSIKETEFKVSNVEVRREFTEGLPRVLVNLNQMEQVLLNLLNNARDAMDGQGSITVRSRLEDMCVCFDVEDTGCGMSAEQMEKVFFPFFTTKGVGKGTGLGLSISYGIIKSLGGRIEVRSEEGAGTTFTVMFPIRKGLPAEQSVPGLLKISTAPGLRPVPGDTKERS